MINDKIWCELSAVVEQTAKNIWNSNRLPNDLRLSFNELKSDCYAQCGYLVNNYRPGALSLKSYVYQYLDKKVCDAIIRDYKTHHKNEMIYIDAGNYYDEDNYTEKHEYGSYEVAANYDDRKKLEIYDNVKTIYEKANKLDKMIIDMILDGKSIPEVADEVGISSRHIYRRLQKYRGVK